MEVVVSIFWQFYADDTIAALNCVCAQTDDERSSTGRRTTLGYLSPAEYEHQHQNQPLMMTPDTPSLSTPAIA